MSSRENRLHMHTADCLVGSIIVYAFCSAIGMVPDRGHIVLVGQIWTMICTWKLTVIYAFENKHDLSPCLTILCVGLSWLTCWHLNIETKHATMEYPPEHCHCRCFFNANRCTPISFCSFIFKIAAQKGHTYLHLLAIRAPQSHPPSLQNDQCWMILGSPYYWL